MIIAVGSKNPIKVNAVEKVFKKYYKDVEVKSIDLSSKFPKQPIGLNNVINGAYKRAKYAISCVKDASYGVGIEAGLINFPFTITGYLNIQVYRFCQNTVNRTTMKTY